MEKWYFSWRNSWNIYRTSFEYFGRINTNSNCFNSCFWSFCRIT